MGLAFSLVGNINGRWPFIPFVAVEGFLFGPTAGSQAHKRLVNHNACHPGSELRIETKLRERKTAVYALIEREYKMPIERVEQDLQGVVLDADEAANLGAKPGAPALRIVRRYYSDSDKLLEVADNVHPSDRFTYHMQLRK